MSFSARLFILVALLLDCVSARAVTIEPVALSDGAFAIVVAGEFDFEDDAAALVEPVRRTGAGIVTFHSPGGNVDAAMRFGRMIRALGLSTMQVRSDDCASACTLAFLGGVNRSAQSGAIGVHQSSFGSTDGLDTGIAISAVQTMTARIMSYMEEMGVDPGLMQLALSIDSSDMRYLTSAEMRRYRVTTDDADEDPPTSSWAPTNPAPATPKVPNGSSRSIAAMEPPTRSSTTPPPIDPRPEPNRPNRLALYTGLDFLGRDVAMTSEPDAPICAARCAALDQCRAFTFNTLTPMDRGPNCFLKSSQGELDGNSAAVSGRLLGKMEPDAPTYTFGAIDPYTGIYRNIDIPGHDLTRRAHPTAATEFDCRMACVNESSCAAFTFVAPKKECWLKADIGGTRSMTGAVTGAKVSATFAPTHIDLE